MRSVDLWAEFVAARGEMTPSDRAMLESCGITASDIWFLIGITTARVSAGLYEPEAGAGEAFVTPVLVHDVVTAEAPCPAQTVRFGELVDLVAWHPRRPDRWALRIGAAEWLGAIEPQFMEPEPVPIRRSVLSWFQNGCAGLVLLSPVPADQYRLLLGCRGGVIPEDNVHAAELNLILDHPWPRPRVLPAGNNGGRCHAA